MDWRMNLATREEYRI